MLHENNPICHTGYLTLTDHTENRISTLSQEAHEEFKKNYPTAAHETSRAIFEKINDEPTAPIFSFRDMKKAVALHLISFLRLSKDDDLHNFMFNKATFSSQELYLLSNSIFQMEFHIPRMVSTTKYSAHSVGEVSYQTAIHTNNFKAISLLVTDKKEAINAMFEAVSEKNNELASYLFNHYEFTAADFLNPPDKELAYLLSDYESCPLILEQFLKRGLICPDALPIKSSYDYSMLEHVRTYRSAPSWEEHGKRSEEILLAYGAQEHFVEYPAKKNAFIALYLAVSQSKPGLVSALFDRWNFNAEDFSTHVIKEKKNEWIVLIGKNQSIYLKFKERGLLDVLRSRRKAYK